VAEANRLGIPIVAVVDTNCSPEGIDYVIPGNDDALRAVRLFASRISDAIAEGNQIATEGGLAAQEAAATASADESAKTSELGGSEVSNKPDSEGAQPEATSGIAEIAESTETEAAPEKR